MPLDMPESVLVRFKGEMQPGITLRDLVHAIPLYAIKAGLLTVAKQGKKNVFSGRVLEIRGCSLRSNRRICGCGQGRCSLNHVIELC